MYRPLPDRPHITRRRVRFASQVCRFRGRSRRRWRPRYSSSLWMGHMFSILNTGNNACMIA